MSDLYEVGEGHDRMYDVVHRLRREKRSILHAVELAWQYCTADDVRRAEKTLAATLDMHRQDDEDEDETDT